jgi:hypothetical protein
MIREGVKHFLTVQRGQISQLSSPKVVRNKVNMLKAQGFTPF